jgi:hypothetical protein
MFPTVGASSLLSQPGGAGVKSQETGSVADAVNVEHMTLTIDVDKHPGTV